MKTKQLVGMIVAAVLVIVIGVTGALTNALMGKFSTETFWNKETQEEPVSYGAFIGVLDIVGEIGPSEDSLYAINEEYDHDLYMNYVDGLMEDSNNKGLVLYIDSPGGTVYESDELYLKLMEYKEVTGRPIWAYFGSQACSGGYYIGMAADKIYANRNCWTGSVGVIVSLLNCKELYDKLGIKEIDITSGANKAMGSSGLEVTEEQYEILQSLVDEAYDQFVEIVCTGRNLKEKEVRALADGRIYSAQQALELKMIDAIGSLEEMKEAFEKEASFSEEIYYDEPVRDTSLDFLNKLFQMFSDLKPESELDLAQDIMENNGNGVLKYYAK